MMMFDILIKARPGGWQGAVVPRFERFVLNTLAALNSSGRWSSQSEYLGHRHNGKNEGRYDVRPAMDRRSGIDTFFFDGEFGESLPFMVMWDLEPTKLASEGMGKLIRPEKLVDSMTVQWFLSKSP
jgi:hypothetical protein